MHKSLTNAKHTTCIKQMKNAQNTQLKWTWYLMLQKKEIHKSTNIWEISIRFRTSGCTCTRAPPPTTTTTCETLNSSFSILTTSWNYVNPTVLRETLIASLKINKLKKQSNMREEAANKHWQRVRCAANLSHFRLPPSIMIQAGFGSRFTHDNAINVQMNTLRRMV